MVRWLVLALSASVLGGCPRECEQPDAEIPLVGAERDPSLGAFEGTLDWLQTGEKTSLRITAKPAGDAKVATGSCDYVQLQISYAVQASDQSISLTQTVVVSVDNAGLVVPQTSVLTLPVSVLVENGKLPEAPGVEDRSPTATLVLEPTIDEGLSATLFVSSRTDQLTVALGTLTRAP
jgi:hypothetical protein